MNTMRRNISTGSSNIDRWDPSKGDYIPLDSTKEVKILKMRVRREAALIILLSFSTISIFLAAIYYFSFA
jgi:hypothetical protein